ncbi:MAG: acylphosphatase [Luteolibacter sp.]
MITKRIIYSGRVQGVGFRYTCKDIARGYDVIGSVRNLTDGTVELIASGEPQEVEDFLQEISEDSPIAHHIQSAMFEVIDGYHGKGFQILRD